MPTLFLDSLESFPAPPSFIPPSPRSSTPNSNPFANPPPSRPPSAPLPPIPGPSRISESDTFLLFGPIRNSKYSVSSRPDSVASIASAKSNGAHYTFSPNDHSRRRDSNSSSLSGSSKVSQTLSDKSIRGHEAIRESHLEDEDEDEDGESIFDPAEVYGGTMSSGDEGERQEQLTNIRLSPMPADNDQHLDTHRNHSTPLSARFPKPPPLSSKDHNTLAMKRLSLSSSISSASASKRSPLTHRAPLFRHENNNSVESSDSISSISMHDLPPDEDSGSGEEFDIPTTTNYPLPPRIQFPPSLKTGAPRHSSDVNYSAPQLQETPLSPETPLICQTPPTPQSPAFDQSRSHPVFPSHARQGRARSSLLKPAPDPDWDETSHMGSLQPSTSASVTALPSTVSARQPPQSSPEPLSPAHVEFPTKIQFPESISPTDYVPVNDPLLIHRELRSARSRSASHKKRLNDSRSTSLERSPVPDAIEDNPFQSNAVLPRGRGSSTTSVSVAERATGKRAMTGPPPSSFIARADKGRSGSPDIEDMLENTPRPKRRTSAGKLRGSASTSSFGSGRRSASMPRKSRTSSRSSSFAYSTRRRFSEGRTRESRDDQIARLEQELEGIGSDDESVTGYPGRGEQFKLEDSQSLTGSEDLFMDDDDEGSASDSSLDIHTPLPHILLRDGALSHKSKLLPPTSIASMDSVNSVVSLTSDLTRPGSTMSLRSNASNTSLLKDVRDTPVRRLRHKDGKLLKGGLGLTTGLGWSDSEDEDAPSPLTRRLSSLLVSRRTSLASLGRDRPSNLYASKSYGNLRTSSYSSESRNSNFSRRPSDLSRSHSGATLREVDEFETDDDGYASATYHGYSTGTQHARGVPPSSWQQGYRQSNSLSSRRGVTSTGSLNVSIPHIPSTPKSKVFEKGIARSTSESSIRTPAHFRGQYAATEELLKTPSSSSSISSVSIPAPLTPKDDEVPTPTPYSSTRIDANKVLPPLPNPKTGSIRRPAAPGLAARFTSPGNSSTRARSNSVGTSLSTSSSLPTISDTPPLPDTSVPVSPTIGTLKPLRLPRHSAGAMSGTRSIRTSPNTPTSPTAPSLSTTSASSLPRPRTGTGMTYRKSSSPQTMLRTPSTPMLRSPSATRI